MDHPFGGRRRPAVALLLAALLMTLGVAAAAPSGAAVAPSAPGVSPKLAGSPKLADDPALPRSEVDVTKSNDLDGAAFTPGSEFKYHLTIQCSGLKVDCVNETFTDTLPAGLDVTSLPGSTPTRTVTYDQATRLLTIVFKQPLQTPEGEFGLKAGSTVNVEIGMRLPADTQLRDGTTLTNTARVDADNADPASDSNDVVVSVPRKVTPVATKAWADGSAVAGTKEQTTVTLGVRNGSSSSAEVTSLSVTDETAATYENFDLTGVSLTSFPAGADRAQLFVKTTGGFVAGPTAGSVGPLGLPDGVDAADVTGVRVVFTDAAGRVLPYDATGGQVTVGLVLRDTRRSDGSPIRPTTKLTINNCATPAGDDRVQGSVAGANACKSFDILPDTLDLLTAKAFFPDTNGNFNQDNGEYAVLGASSAVSAKVDVKNNSPFDIAEITIIDPDPSGKAASEFDKFDAGKVRLRFPNGAKNAALTVTYDDGTTFANTYTANATVAVAEPGKRVTSVEVVYTGRDANGAGTIAQGATAGLDLSGTLNDKVTAADLPNGTSPGVDDCASYAGSAGRTDGTGTASGAACKTLQIQAPRATSEGVKDVGQTEVPPGQPIPFSLRVANNGNLPLVKPVISDPRTGPDGKPDPNFANPFDTLQLTSASISQDGGTPPVTIEVYDPDAGRWVAYVGDDAALLQRAKGVRASMQGNLAPTKSFTLLLVTERREGTKDGTPILNCFSTAAGGDYIPGGPSCAPQIETGPANDSASLNKSISPGTLPVFVPGLPPHFADVRLTVRNNGNLSAKYIEATDDDADFFDGVNFTGFTPVQLPVGADRVQVDAFVNGAWVDGDPAAQAQLPPGVAPADVTGVRATFSSTSTANSGYALTPCASRRCEGVLTFRVSPRQFLRSDATQPVPAALENTVSGAFETQIQAPGKPRQIPPVAATLKLTKGTPALDVEKSPNSVIAPGETAPFNLRVTNVGTANVPDLVVKDTIPRGIAFDDTFAGDGGLPFKVIATKVPAGTPPVPTPVFTEPSTGDRVSDLAWDFSRNADGSPFLLAPGATLTILIHVTLAPGIVAGQIVTNAMGASSSDSDLTCAGASDVDGPFGEGRYCTDTATLTAKAGAAFQARKWVAGTPALGWYDTRTRAQVRVGARACPSTIDAAGRQYTAFPCIALVNPGDQYKYLLRLVNSGTEAGTDMRIIDRFPVQGDKGVIVNQDRGTEWNNRPTLASEPKLDGPGVLTTTYVETEPICTKDLDMGGGRFVRTAVCGRRLGGAVQPCCRRSTDAPEVRKAARAG